MHNENVLSPDTETEPSVWSIPAGADVDAIQAFAKFGEDLAQYHRDQSRCSNFRGAYQDYNAGELRDQTYPDWTKYTESFQGTVDHVFVNENIVINKILALPEESEVIQETALPNTNYPSDHLRLEVVFRVENMND